MQVLLNMLRGYTAQAALDAPRFCISAGMPDAEVKGSKNAGDVNSEVYFEEGIDDETITKLRGWCYINTSHSSSNILHRDGTRCTRSKRFPKEHDGTWSSYPTHCRCIWTRRMGRWIRSPCRRACSSANISIFYVIQQSL